MKDIIYSLLPACKEPDMDSFVPFKAEAIIANPPAYGRLSINARGYSKVYISRFFINLVWVETSLRRSELVID